MLRLRITILNKKCSHTIENKIHQARDFKKRTYDWRYNNKKGSVYFSKMVYTNIFKFQFKF